MIFWDKFVGEISLDLEKFFRLFPFGFFLGLNPVPFSLNFSEKALRLRFGFRKQPQTN